MFFQSPFPYSQNEHAIKSAYYRRKVIKTLLDFLREENQNIPYVSDAIYTRWDPISGSYSLGTEYIEGREVTPLEMASLVKIMEPLTELFYEIGLPGLAWQTEAGNKFTGVATKNFLKNRDEWYWVDLESGVVSPSLKYLQKDHGYFVFDDIDFNKLRKYLGSMHHTMRNSLGDESLKRFYANPA